MWVGVGVGVYVWVWVCECGFVCMNEDQVQEKKIEIARYVYRRKMMGAIKSALCV